MIKDMSVCTFARLSGCSILSDKNCEGCSFFKTDREFFESRAIAWLRLTSLPEKVRAKIQHKYYRRDLKEGRQ